MYAADAYGAPPMSARAGKIADMDTDSSKHTADTTATTGTSGHRDSSSFEDGELDAFLAATDRADSWRVERTLKRSPFETTELVSFVGAAGGTLGPFVRKRIDCSAGVGSAYEALWEAQRRGHRIMSVPRIIECARTGEILTVVTEYVDGPTLDEFVCERGPSSALARDMGILLCDAVAEFHEGFTTPLIHRDLKPGNIIVSNGYPVVIDFGIARTWNKSAQADTAYFGTRPYAPPEQYGFGQTDVRSDVYALGKLLIFCATGDEMRAATDNGSLVEAGLDPSLAAVAARATAFDPADRYQTARELMDALCDVEVRSPNLGAVSRHSTDSSKATGERGRSRTDGTSDRVPSAERANTDLASTNAEDPRDLDEAFRQAFSRLRIPLIAGDFWNLFMVLMYVMCIIVSIENIMAPPPDMADYPLWFLVLEHVQLFFIGYGAITYLMLDKRRLRKWIKPLASVPRRIEVAVCVGIVVWCFASTVVAGIIAGI